MWLRHFFRYYGEIVDCHVPSRLRKNTKLKFGFVLFVRKKDGEEAMKGCNGLLVKNSKIRVSWATYVNEGEAGKREGLT